jgi:hypothetical protein
MGSPRHCAGHRVYHDRIVQETPDADAHFPVPVGAEGNGEPSTDPSDLASLSDLNPVMPVQRYEHAHPGDLIHLDTKMLAH